MPRDLVTTPTRAELRPAADLGRATPHASPRQLTGDDVTMETYCHGRRLILIGVDAAVAIARTFCIDL